MFKVGDVLVYRNKDNYTVMEVTPDSYGIDYVANLASAVYIPKDYIHQHFRKLTKLEKALK